LGQLSADAKRGAARHERAVAVKSVHGATPDHLVRLLS
jgi:hypothetical protein